MRPCKIRGSTPVYHSVGLTCRIRTPLPLNRLTVSARECTSPDVLLRRLSAGDHRSLSDTFRGTRSVFAFLYQCYFSTPFTQTQEIFSQNYFMQLRRVLLFFFCAAAQNSVPPAGISRSSANNSIDTPYNLDSTYKEYKSGTVFPVS